MERTNLPHKSFLILFIGALLLFGALLTSTAKKTSLVYDEVIYAPSGLIYWKTGDFRWNAVHPPLQKLISGLPLLFHGVEIPKNLETSIRNEWRMGYRIFFESPSALRLIFHSRIPTMLISLAMAVILFFLVLNRTSNAAAGFLASAVWMFDPLVLGNGALAMDDMFVCCFSFLALLAFMNWAQISPPTTLPQPASAALCGFATGAAIMSKLSALLLIPIFTVLWFWKKKFNRTELKNQFIEIGFFAFSAAFIALLSYRFNFNFIRETVLTELSFHKGEGAEGFLLGPIPGNAGWYYYPIALIIKTPLPLLALWIAGFCLFFKNKSKFKNEWRAIILSVCIFWLGVFFSRNRFGIRYFLPIAPLLAISVGYAYFHLQSKKEALLFWVLVGWLVMESLIHHPHHMAYFNQLIGGPSQGYRWLDGSNQDWGQDLPALADFLKKQNPHSSVLMGYWGSNRPEAWGLDYQDVYSPAITNAYREEKINPVAIDKEWLVVSSTLRAHPKEREVYRWLDDKKPAAFLGNTLFVYDITNDISSVLNIANIYALMGRDALMRRQISRAMLLDPNNPELLQLMHQKGMLSPTAGK